MFYFENLLFLFERSFAEHLRIKHRSNLSEECLQSLEFSIEMSPTLLIVHQILKKIFDRSESFDEFFVHPFVFSSKNLLLFIREKSLRRDRLQTFRVLVEQHFQFTVTCSEILNERERERVKEGRWKDLLPGIDRSHERRKRSTFDEHWVERRPTWIVRSGDGNDVCSYRNVAKVRLTTKGRQTTEQVSGKIFVLLEVCRVDRVLIDTCRCRVSPRIEHPVERI